MPFCEMVALEDIEVRRCTEGEIGLSSEDERMLENDIGSWARADTCQGISTDVSAGVVWFSVDSQQASAGRERRWRQVGAP